MGKKQEEFIPNYEILLLFRLWGGEAEQTG
jgi:hypothetical protein